MALSHQGLPVYVAAIDITSATSDVIVGGPPLGPLLVLYTLLAFDTLLAASEGLAPEEPSSEASKN
jgi:hypothetical protein